MMSPTHAQLIPAVFIKIRRPVLLLHLIKFDTILFLKKL